jgi:XTP/dITP diphosphohydrolase
MSAILIATRNKHKVEEIRNILGSEYSFLALDGFPGAPSILEDAPDFSGNATKKAVGLANWLSRQPDQHGVDFVLADDSGLEVDALNGAPGVHSARFAALDSGAPGNSSDADNNAKLLRLLANVPRHDRTARFKCVIAFTPVPKPSTLEAASPVCYASEPELFTELFEGTCAGRILDAPRGDKGFGYDPLFVPSGFLQTFAELGEELKNRISHRAKAAEKLSQRLQSIIP